MSYAKLRQLDNIKASLAAAPITATAQANDDPSVWLDDWATEVNTQLTAEGVGAGANILARVALIA